MSQQGLRQASVRTLTGTANSYEDDWHALLTLAGIPAGDFNGRLLSWINGQLGASYGNLNGAMAAYAQTQGAVNWSSMGAFYTGPIPANLSGMLVGKGVLSGALSIIGPVALAGSVIGAGILSGALTVTAAGAVALSGSLLGAGLMSGALTVSGGAVIFTDNFNRADENLSVSPNWTLVDGTATQMGVRSNQLAAVGSVESTFLSPDLGSANHAVEGTLALVGANGPFLICRVTNLNNWVGVRNSASTYAVFKRVAGTLTQIGTPTGTPTLGDVLRLEVSGDNVTLKINGAAQGPYSLGGDLVGVTRQGVIARTSARNPWIDDFKAEVIP